jgi:type IV pilus assembly protein PilC
MPKFAYVAAGPDGAETRGVQQAATLAQARLLLTQQHFRVSALAQKRGLADIQISEARVKPAELMHLSRQLSAFLQAGIPILEAISVIGQESGKPAMRRVLAAIDEDLRAGERLCDAIDTRRTSPSGTAGSCAPPSSPASSTRSWISSRRTSSATSRPAARSSRR